MARTTLGAGGVYSRLLTLTEAATGLTDLATTYGTHVKEMDVQGSKFVTFFIDYTKGSETSVQWKIETTFDGTTWRGYPMAMSGALTAVTETSKTATGKFKVAVRVDPRAMSKVRINVKVTGGTDATTAVLVDGSLSDVRTPVY